MANIADVYARFLASRHPNSMLAKNQRITALTDPKSGELLLSSPRNTPVGSFGRQSMANQMSKGLISGGDFADAIPVPPVPSAHALRPDNAPVEALARSQRVPIPSTLPERRQVPRHVPFRPRTLPTNPNLMPTVLDSGRVGVRDLGGGTPISDPMDPGTTLPKAVNIPSIQTPTREQLGVGELEAPMSTSQKLRSFASSPYGREFAESLSKASQHFAAGDSSGAVSALTAGANLATEAQDLADEEQEQEALQLSRAGMSMEKLAESYASKGDWDTASKIQNYNVTEETEDRKNTAYSQIAAINKSINERPDMPVEEKMGLLEQQLRTATSAGLGGAVLQSLNQTLERLMGPTAEVPEEEIWYDGTTPVRVITQPDGSTLKVDSLGNRSPVDISILSKSRIGSEDEEQGGLTQAEKQNQSLGVPARFARQAMEKTPYGDDIPLDFAMTGSVRNEDIDQNPLYQERLVELERLQGIYDDALLSGDLTAVIAAQQPLNAMEDQILALQYEQPEFFSRNAFTGFLAEVLNQNQGQSSGLVSRGINMALKTFGAQDFLDPLFADMSSDEREIARTRFERQMEGYTEAMNYVNPIVRFLSGAQMTNQEAMRYYIALVPMPGEPTNVTAIKRRKRRLLEDAMGGENVSDERRRAALKRLGHTDESIAKFEARSQALTGNNYDINPIQFNPDLHGPGSQGAGLHMDSTLAVLNLAVPMSDTDARYSDDLYYEILQQQDVPLEKRIEPGDVFDPRRRGTTTYEVRPKPGIG